MNLITLVITIGLFIATALAVQQKYHTVHFRDRLKVDSFSFSAYEQHMVVYQGYYYQYTQGSSLEIRNLPHFIYKQTTSGYQLMSKQFMYNATNSDNGKIYINREGNIFVSCSGNNEIRVYQMMNGKSRLAQIIAGNSSYIQNAQLTYTNNMILSSSSNGFAVYKGNNANFTFYFSNNTKHLKVKISHDGKFIIGYNSQSSLTFYINNGLSFETVLYQIQPLEVVPNYLEYLIGRQKDSEVYNLFMIYRGPISTYSQSNSPLKLRYYEFNLKTRKVTLNQQWEIADNKGDYIFYLTKNGQYLAYSNVMSQQLVIYGRKQQKYEYFDKFWNFTEGPSDIYVSEDMNLIAVANKFKPASYFGDKFSNKSQHISFMFKCNVSNCQSCPWINICSKCAQGYSLNKGKCQRGTNNLQKTNQLIQPQPQPIQKSLEIVLQQPVVSSSTQPQIEKDLQQAVSFLAGLLFILYLITKGVKRLCQWCGLNLTFGLQRQRGGKDEAIQMNQSTNQIKSSNKNKKSQA